MEPLLEIILPASIKIAHPYLNLILVHAIKAVMMQMQDLLLILVLPTEGQVVLILIHLAVEDQVIQPLLHLLVAIQLLPLLQAPHILEVILMMFHLLAQEIMTVLLLVVEVGMTHLIRALSLQLLIEEILQKDLVEE